MVPLHIDAAGRAEAIPFEEKPPGRPADARHEIVDHAGGSWRDQPAGERCARFRWTGLAKEEAKDTGLARPEGQPAAGGEVELLRCAADLGDRPGKAAATQSLLENPERLSRPADADDDELARIEAETIESNPIGKPCLACGGRLHDPEDRPAVF